MFGFDPAVPRRPYSLDDERGRVRGSGQAAPGSLCDEKRTLTPRRPERPSGIDALVVLASAAPVLALLGLLGLLGIGVVILLFVVLGSPSSGGVQPAPLLGSFWGAIGQALPPGAGTAPGPQHGVLGPATASALRVPGAYALGGAPLAWAAS